MPVPLKALSAFPYARRSLKAGQVFDANKKDAHVLVTIGRAELHRGEAVIPRQTYSTRVMVPDLDGMSLDDLRALAAKLKVRVHHRAGADKIRMAIRAA